MGGKAVYVLYSQYNDHCGNRNGVYVQTFRDLMESEELLEEDIEDETPLHKANDVVSV